MLGSPTMTTASSFFTRQARKTVGQVLPGSHVTDALTADITQLDISSLTGIGFVPLGMPGASTLKATSWDGRWYSLTRIANPNGTYEVLDIDQGPPLLEGPMGFSYIEGGNPGFPQDTVLVGKWDGIAITAYDIDDQADPIPASARPFMAPGFDSGQSLVRDPLSGSLLFLQWSYSDNVYHLIVVRGFHPPPGEGS